jgi:hypothetical protein
LGNGAINSIRTHFGFYNWPLQIHINQEGHM